MLHMLILKISKASFMIKKRVFVILQGLKHGAIFLSLKVTFAYQVTFRHV